MALLDLGSSPKASPLCEGVLEGETRHSYLRRQSSLLLLLRLAFSILEREYREAPLV